MLLRQIFLRHYLSPSVSLQEVSGRWIDRLIDEIYINV